MLIAVGKIVVADSSFLINIHIMKWITLLCRVYDKVFVTPTVARECIKIKGTLDRLPCIESIELTREEEKKVSELLSIMAKKFPGEHRGEIECLAASVLRGVPLLISDNFAPWYLQSQDSALAKVRIVRGYYFVAEALEMSVLTARSKRDAETIIRKLSGVYPREAIDRIRKTLLGSLEGEFK